MCCNHAQQQACRLQADISAEKMIMGVEGVDAARRDRLIKLLDIDLKWRLNKVSDGQRRRVQICMGLLKPYKVHTVFILGAGGSSWLGVAAGAAPYKAWQTAGCQRALRLAQTCAALLTCVRNQWLSSCWCIGVEHMTPALLLRLGAGVVAVHRATTQKRSRDARQRQRARSSCRSIG